MEKIQNKIFSSHQKFSPNRLIVFSFYSLFLAGGFLLSLPIRKVECILVFWILVLLLHLLFV